MRHHIPGPRPDRQRRRMLLDTARFEILPLPGGAPNLGGLPRGATVTVTASPRLGVQATVDLAAALAESGFTAVPHLAARRFTGEDELDAALRRFHDAGVREVFVVGGDTTTPAGPFVDGLSLLKAIDSAGYRFDRIGVPSYPEGHPTIDDDTLWSALASKQHYATYTVTQMCFDGRAVTRFIRAARVRGITLPVVAGMPGVVAPAKLLRVGLRIGVGDSLRFVRGHQSVAKRLLRPLGYRPDTLMRQLAADQQVTGLHFYTFNEIAATLRWLEQQRRSTTREEVASNDHAV
ncbi:methylenetetrahydrofolate reductase [Phytoactinopolyspora limicola]|uniref:methylenetetrahydrofolate reductase n=1 Tax=Phytoactinopolyspora limicola TaxID=2715536 RepID=UPI00140CAAE3|nr:methylenetetrahydrofolate reductase [Phytoactinopolyspora limicola]